MSSERPRNPVFNDMPPAVAALSVAIFLVSAAGLLLPYDGRAFIFAAGAVVINIDETQPFGHLAPYALHVFVHANWLHLGMNLAALVAFGAGAARGLGPGWRGAAAWLAIFYLAAIAGAGTEAVFAGSEPRILVGASGGVFGLIAGAVYVYSPVRDRLPSPWSPTYLAGLAPWVALNLAIPVAGRFISAVGDIAWKAHLGGLVVGVLLFPLARAWARAGRRD